MRIPYGIDNVNNRLADVLNFLLSEKPGQRMSIVSITWMEVMEGVASKAHQAACKSILTRFDLLFLSAAD
jgi:hypothetical protein